MTNELVFSLSSPSMYNSNSNEKQQNCQMYYKYVLLSTSNVIFISINRDHLQFQEKH